MPHNLNSYKSMDIEQGQQYFSYNNTQQYETMNESARKIEEYAENTARLKGMEEILENQVNEKQNQVKELFFDLNRKKKQLLQLITIQHNTNEMELDLGQLEEFQELRERIQKQEELITNLRGEIKSQGLASASNSVEILNMKKKVEELEDELQKAQKFSSTQYVRDYLQKTHVYKVSYEDVKYEYEVKIRHKQYLEKEKKSYKQKEQELKQASQEQHRLNVELETEFSNLEKKLNAIHLPF